MSAPTSAAQMTPIRIRYLRRSVTSGKRVAGLLRWRGLRLRLGLLRLVRLVRRDDAADRAPRHAHLEVGSDLQHDVVTHVLGDPAVDAAGGHDLVADLDLAQHPLLRDLPLLLRPDEHEPEEREREDDEEEEPAAATACADHPV